MPVSLLALALSAFAIGTTEFVIMGLLPEVAGDLSGLNPFSRLVDQRLCPRRGDRGADHGVADGEAAAQEYAAVADGDFYLRQYHVRAGLQLRFPDAGAHCHRVVPRCVLRHRRGGGRQSGTAESPSFRCGADVHRPDVGQRAGVPLGTALGQALGWRSTFWAVAVIGVLSLLALYSKLPAVEDEAPTDLKKSWRPCAAAVSGFRC